MAIPTETITLNTLNSVTNKVWIQKNIEDLLRADHPLLDALLSRRRKGGGTEIKFDVEYQRLAGGWRASGTAAMTQISPEIVSQGKLGWGYAYASIKLERARISENVSDPDALTNYLNLHVRACIKTMRDVYLGPGLWTTPANGFTSLADAINDTASYANLNTTTMPSWKSVIAESTYSSGDKPVSPSISNFSMMLDRVQKASGGRVDVIVTSPEVKDALKKQVVTVDPLAGTRTGGTATVGLSDVNITGGNKVVPVISDLQYSSALCSDYVANQANRGAANGHEAMFLSYDSLHLYYMPGWNLAWDPRGWMSTNPTVTDYINNLFFTGNIVCVNRAANGRIFGIDPSQPAADFTDMTVSMTPFVVSAGA